MAKPVHITLFPNLPVNPGTRSNPYIQDFIKALNAQEDVSVVNPPHKNPLLSILKRKSWGNTFIFNWFESIPDFKYGLLQSLTAIVFLNIIRLSGRKIVWILHNKKPHANGHTRIKKYLAKLIASHSTLIITHATEGIELIKENYPFALGKSHFLHHPTKNRLPEVLPADNRIQYDLLIWGQIAKYKGVTEFIDFLKKKAVNHLKVCVIGECRSAALFDELRKNAPENVTLINQSPSFEELSHYAGISHFVLNPYSPESILSSGVLMDSLSFGAKIIGPNVGSFKDYAQEPRLKVYTFNHFEEISSIVGKHKHEHINPDAYRQFLDENNWNQFASELVTLLTQK